MNNSKKTHEVVRQNDQNVKKSQKHDANLQKNTTLYFQVGLILCLLASYTALEMTFASTNDDFAHDVKRLDEIHEPDAKIYKVEKVKTQKPIRVKPLDPIYKPVDEETPITEEELVDQIVEPVDSEPTTNPEPLDPDTLIVAPVDIPMSIMGVQKVPIYPGCESSKNNDERRKCMSDKFSKLIRKKFDGDLGGELGLQGKQKIWVKFKIDKQGEIVILNTRSPHAKLDKEAIRVIEKAPKMQPGINDNRPVEVLYMLPINLNIQN